MSNSITIEPNVEVCRILKVNDRNVHGKVHGGVILQIIEEAGYIVCFKHCNKEQNNTEQILPLLCRIEHTNFIAPLDITELVIAKAKIVYSTNRTLRVEVDVYTDKLLTNKSELKCKAILWYCGTILDRDVDKIIPVRVPQVICNDDKLCEKYKNDSETNKKNRINFKEYETNILKSLSNNPNDTIYSMINSDVSNELSNTVIKSTTVMYHIVRLTDCTPNGYLTGGALLKRMDECGAISAWKYCRHPIVTGCIDAVDFHAPTKHGCFLIVVARVTFTCKRIIEVQVIAIEENPLAYENGQRLICSSYFTFVTVSAFGLPAIDVPQLNISSNEEQLRFNEGEIRFNKRKLERSKDKV